MKKTVKNIRTAGIAVLLLAGLTAVSCSHETIFYQINQETELEEAVITGTVNSVVELNGKLYACDGNIYSKDKNALRGWSKIRKPAEHIEKLAADAKYLYALDKRNGRLYCTNGTDGWTKVTTSFSIQTIFSDGAGTAYLQSSDKFYTLSGNGTPTEASGITSPFMVKVTATGKTYSVKDGNTVTDGTAAVDAGSEIRSITYSAKTGCLYVGTKAGVKRITFADDGTMNKADDTLPGSNRSATIKSYEALAVFATTQEIAGEQKESLYVGTIAAYSYNAAVGGLWGYYETRGNWNCE